MSFAEFLRWLQDFRSNDAARIYLLLHLVAERLARTSGISHKEFFKTIESTDFLEGNTHEERFAAKAKERFDAQLSRIVGISQEKYVKKCVNAKRWLEKFMYEARAIDLNTLSSDGQVIRAKKEIRALDLTEEYISKSEFDKALVRFLGITMGLSDKVEPLNGYNGPWIEKLLLNLVAGQNAKTVYDPICGLGSMLVEKAMDPDRPSDLTLVGQESDNVLAAWAKIRGMLLLGENFKIATDDILLNDHFEDRRFGAIASVLPPFAMWKHKKSERYLNPKENWFETPRFSMGLPRDDDASLLWVQHIVSKMRPASQGGGRASIVVSGTSLWAPGSNEIRMELIDRDLVDTIICLPRDLLFNYRTYTNTFILVLSNAKKQDQKGKVRIIDAKEIGSTHPEAGKIWLKEEVSNVLEMAIQKESSSKVKFFANYDFKTRHIRLKAYRRYSYYFSVEHLEKLRNRLLNLVFRSPPKPEPLDTSTAFNKKNAPPSLEKINEGLKPLSNQTLIVYKSMEANATKHIKKGLKNEGEYLKSFETEEECLDFVQDLLGELKELDEKESAAWRFQILFCCGVSDPNGEVRTSPEGEVVYDKISLHLPILPFATSEDEAGKIANTDIPAIAEGAKRLGDSRDFFSDGTVVKCSFNRIKHLGFGFQRDLEILKDQFKECTLRPFSEICHKGGIIKTDREIELEDDEVWFPLKNYKVKINTDLVLRDYVKKFFSTEVGKKVFFLFAHKDDGPPYDLYDLLLPVPSINEQEEYLGTFNQLEKIQTELSRMKESLAANPRNIETVRKEVFPVLDVLNKISDSDRVRQLASEGTENKRLEFKSTFFLCMHKNEPDKRVEESALKTIVAFMNSEGGDLLIGVKEVQDDKIEIIGADYEFGKSKNLKTWDRYSLHIKNIVRKRIGEAYYPFFEDRLVSVDEKKVLWFKCEKATSPVFLDGESFYVRTNPATDKLVGPKQVEYIKNRFG
jgi:type I restriction-modification system DNA methylase subunit